MHEDGGAGLGELPQVRRGHEIREPVVGSPRHDDAHVDPPPGRDAERAREGFVGHEVGGRDPEPALGAEDRGEDGVVDGVGRRVRTARHDEDGHGVRGGISPAGRREALAAGELPVGAEHVVERVATASPVTRIERSRHLSGFGAGPMYSSARFIPPTMARSPSKSAILRWSRRFERPRNGR